MQIQISIHPISSIKHRVKNKNIIKKIKEKLRPIEKKIDGPKIWREKRLVGGFNRRGGV